MSSDAYPDKVIMIGKYMIIWPKLVPLFHHKKSKKGGEKVDDTENFVKQVLHIPIVHSRQNKTMIVKQFLQYWFTLSTTKQ